VSRILITGASGFVGSHVVPAFIERGHIVAALVRSEEAGAKVLGRLLDTRRSSVELRYGDVTKAQTLVAAVRDVDAVLHLVAIPRDWDRGSSLRLVNVEGTRNVVEAARAGGIRRFLHQGALGVSDDPQLHYASSKANGEQIVAESGLDWTVFKPSLLWGERDGFFNIIAGLIRFSPGVVPIPGSGRSRFQPLWVRDLARVLVAALEKPGTIGATYELGGPRHWTYREITQEILRSMGAHRLILPMPVPLISFLARGAEWAHIPFPVASDQLRQLRLDNVGPLDTVERQFGFAPADMAGHLEYLRRRRRDQEPILSEIHGGL
jgi:uncharacterized protein YbjT (DUF2867 family)